MRRVNPHFKSLQPVAVPQALEGKGVGARCFKAVKGGEGRRCAALRPKPAKQNATFLHHRIAALLDAVTQFAASGFGRRLQALPAGGKLPPVKWATQAAALGGRLQTPKRQIGTPVRAVAVQQPECARCVFEQHQILTQNAHGFHRAQRHIWIQQRVKLINQGYGLPIVAHQLATGRAGTYAGDQVVLFCSHGVS